MNFMVREQIGLSVCERRQVLPMQKFAHPSIFIVSKKQKKQGGN
jgi:hypothetical protein